MKTSRKILGFVLNAGLIIALFILWFNRATVYDWYRLRNYTPPFEVVTLADNTTMTTKARRLFYVNRPQIVKEDEFRSACSQEATIVLGCYIPNRGIYIFDITDKRLEGVEEVTAAHELLHAAYDRLDSRERTRIDDLTLQAYNTVSSERIRKNVENYRKQDPSVVPNELHSILATEVEKLPQQLENYYSQYFSKRSQIVAYSNAYEREFDSRREKYNAISQQIDNQKVDIDVVQNNLRLEYNALLDEKRRLDLLLSNGNIDDYNASVTAFNVMVREYNASVRSLQAKIDAYNQLVEQARSLQVEINDLVDAIDAQPQTF